MSSSESDSGSEVQDKVVKEDLKVEENDKEAENAEPAEEKALSGLIEVVIELSDTQHRS